MGRKKEITMILILTLAANLPAFASGPESELTQEPLRNELAQAKTILAKIIADDAVIEVKIVEEILWRNGALGCPKADGIYTQALIKGYRIILIAEDRDYAFHGREKGLPVYCESPGVLKK